MSATSDAVLKAFTITTETEEQRRSSSAADQPSRTTGLLYSSLPVSASSRFNPNGFITFESDHRAYRHLVLENGLTVFLVHDNKRADSSAVLDIESGFFQEPEQYPGLAHYLEHILFLGTTKYPESGSYKKYVNENKGITNAHTTDEETRYHFTVPNEFFAVADGALARFSEFFKSSLLLADRLDPSLAKRELNAVNEEFARNREQDPRRIHHVQKQLISPKHPASRFHDGNYKTLKVEELDQIMIALKRFYQDYYTPDRMRLVLVSNLHLFELEALARLHFSDIPCPQKKIPKQILPPRFTEKEMGAITTIESIQEHNEYTVTFVIPIPKTDELVRALSYISYLLGSSSEHGLLSNLKRRGWIEGSVTNPELVDDAFVHFQLTFVLTAEGLAKTDEITAYYLRYIDFIRKQGIDESFYDEMKLSDARTYRFSGNVLNNDNGSSFIDHLKRYPLKRVFIGAMLEESDPFPAALIKQILDQFTCANMRHIFLKKSITAEESGKAAEDGKAAREAVEIKVEEHMGARYVIRPFSQKQLALWQNPPLDISYQLPDLNPFTPKDFSIARVFQASKQPRLLMDRERLRIWHLPDVYRFNKPQATTKLFFISKYARDTVQHSVMHTIFYQLIADSYNIQLSRQCITAGISPDMNSRTRGLELIVESFSDNHGIVVQRIIELIATLKVTDDLLKQAIETTEQDIKKAETDEPIAQCETRLGDFLDPFNYPYQEQLLALKAVDLDTFMRYKTLLINSYRLELYCYGNIDPIQSIQIGESAIATLIPDLKKTLPAPAQGILVNLKPGFNYQHLLQLELKDKQFEVKSNAVFVFLQAPDISCETYWMLRMLENLIYPKFFHQLRTEEALAYNVQCMMYNAGNIFGLSFKIESSTYTAQYLVSRIERFMVEYSEEFSKMSGEALEVLRSTFEKEEDKQLFKPNTASEYADNFTFAIESGKYGLERRFNMKAAIREITPSKLQQFYANLVSEKTKRQLVIRTRDKGETSNSKNILLDPTLFKRQCEMMPDYMVEGERNLSRLKALTRRLNRDAKALDDLSLLPTRKLSDEKTFIFPLRFMCPTNRANDGANGNAASRMKSAQAAAAGASNRSGVEKKEDAEKAATITMK